MKSTHVGFNFQWMFMQCSGTEPTMKELKTLDFLVDEGFSFIRIPMNYWNWIDNFHYDSPREDRLQLIESYVKACADRELHISLNLHRAPGYCINGNEKEKHNLWTDSIAQDAFISIWQGFARRFKDYSPEQLSFDLLNEPPGVDQYGMSREIHKNIMLQVIDAIRGISPQRPITLDGLGGGNLAMPELADTGCIQSNRGYQPMAITHYKADWCPDTLGLPLQDYPGTIYHDERWDKERMRKHFQPWVELAESGVPVHMGEMGCYNSIPNDTALRWFEDIFSLLRELGWGFGLWEFEGAFGVVNHGRPGTRWENRKGFHLDSDLWGMIKDTRDYLNSL